MVERSALANVSGGCSKVDRAMDSNDSNCRPNEPEAGGREGATGVDDVDHALIPVPPNERPY